MSHTINTRVGRSTSIVALAAAVVLLAAPASSAMQNPMGGRLTLDFYTRVEGVGNPQISPDGSTILYSRSFIDMQNDGRRSEIWMMAADGSRKRKFMAGGSPQ